MPSSSPAGSAEAKLRGGMAGCAVRAMQCWVHGPLRSERRGRYRIASPSVGSCSSSGRRRMAGPRVHCKSLRSGGEWVWLRRYATWRWPIGALERYALTAAASVHWSRANALLGGGPPTLRWRPQTDTPALACAGALRGLARVALWRIGHPSRTCRSPFKSWVSR